MIYVIFGIFIALVIFIAIVAKKKLDKDVKTNPFQDKSQIYLELNSDFIHKKEIEFFDLLNEILPKKYLTLMRVGLDSLISPKGNKTQYNEIRSKYVDFCIFERNTGKPLLVVDLFDNGFSNTSIKELESSVLCALQAVKLPIASFMIENFYVQADILKALMQYLEPNNKK